MRNCRCGLNKDIDHSTCRSCHDRFVVCFQVMWQFVQGMLTNLESLPLERIHAMLLMFAAQDSSVACNKDELKQFLDKKVKSQALVYASGVYRLPPKNG